MVKNIIEKAKLLYLEKFEDTTREPDDGIPELLSNVFVQVELPFLAKLKFLFRRKILYRLKRSEIDFIKRYKGL